jgi:Ca2+:H+ antiporter
MAMRNQIDLAVNIAVGSSIQVAPFVAPVLVFSSYAFGRPMDLVFTTFEVVAVTIAAGVATLVAMDGESNWMEGSNSSGSM